MSIALLERALDRVLDQVSTKHGDTVTLSADHYWVLPPELASELTAAPSAGVPTVAQYRG